MTDAEALSDKIYEEYDPENRGKAPSVTRAAARYLALLATDADDIDQEDVADDYDVSAHALRNRKQEILAEIDIEGYMEEDQ